MARGKTAAAENGAARTRADGATLPAQSRVRKIARELRNDAIRMEVGALIGSEDDLVERYGVSRPTLRQAAASVVQEQLVEVRRGVGGGYFARRPDSRSVTHMASIFFRSHGTTMADILAAVEPIRIELARLAARNKKPERQKELKAFIARRRAAKLGVDRESYIDYLKSLNEFGEIVGRMSENDPLYLFQSILYDFCAHVRREEDIYFGRLDRMATHHEQMLRVGEAILARDEEIAVLASRRNAKMITQWMMEDIGRSATRSVNDVMSRFPEVDDIEYGIA